MINIFNNSKEIAEIKKELAEIKKEVFVEEEKPIELGADGYYNIQIMNWFPRKKNLAEKVKDLEKLDEKLNLILNHLKLEIVTKPQEDSKLIIRKAKKQNA